MEIIDKIPANFVDFILVDLFSLIIGLAQRRIHSHNPEDKRLFGTDRTFTFIGILGFILYVAQPDSLALYIGGGFVVALFLGLYYYQKLKVYNDYGLTTIIIAIVTYSLAPLIVTQPRWFAILIVVVILVLTEIKEPLTIISQKFDKDEFITLGMFLVIAGVILPIVPDEPLFSFINITPYKIWLAVVAISSISYLSYILKKFVFKNTGIIISGLLGGMYSSTATTFVLARKSREEKKSGNLYSSAIILSTAMLYLRILILVYIFNRQLAVLLTPYFLVMFVVSLLPAWIIYRKKNNLNEDNQVISDGDKNPLEFKIAFLFTVLFVAFSFITYFVIKEFGVNGLNVLSFVVGITDIDPFLINLFQGKFNVETQVLAFATFQAIISNNLLKAVYTYFIGDKSIRKNTITGLGIIILSNIFLELLMMFVF
ncbi:MAG: DUF4010 domain-containing protein [Bacteroidales bacterium]|nr:DUF4010 domain-containing protein [Bacteroidales bacterium]